MSTGSGEQQMNCPFHNESVASTGTSKSVVADGVPIAGSVGWQVACGRAVPGPVRLDALQHIIALQKAPLETMTQLHKHYGDVVSLGIARSRRHFVFHPDAIREVLVDKAKYFPRSDVLKQIVGKVLGNGLAVSQSDLWLQQRRTMQSSLRAECMSNYALTMAKCINRLMHSWTGEQEADAAQLVYQMATHVSCNVLFGVDGDSFEGKEIIRGLTAVMKELDATANRFVEPPQWMPSQVRFQKSKEQLYDVFFKLIAQRKGSGHRSDDWLSAMIGAAEQSGAASWFSDTQLADEMLTILVGAHGVTAVTWTLYLLAKHRNVQEKVVDELERVLQGNDILPRHLPDLKFTSMVVKESLRLYPPAWLTLKQATEDVDVSGFLIRKGETLTISSAMVQRDPRFFEAPDEFIPERFSAGKEETINRFAYIPFGAGARSCIGEQYAMTQQLLTLGAIVSRFELTLLSGDAVRKPKWLLGPGDAIKIRFTRRNVPMRQRTSELIR